jgi:PAS domain S-box-containing protein
MPKKSEIPDASEELRRSAETLLLDQRMGERLKGEDPQSEADVRRLVHELQVHQLELEMQNSELQEARDRMESLLEKYTDLYDFAPVGYFSVDKEGVIQEVNLTGAVLLGVERSRLVNQRLPHFVVSDSQPIFRAFLDRVVAKTGKQVCEAALVKKDATIFWASLHGTSTPSDNGRGKSCRVAVSDITSLKQGEEAQRRMKALALSNRNMSREIARRQAVEEALRTSEQHSRELLEQSRQMQEQLQLLSRQVLSAQEEERKKISRELHDVVAQTLTSINVQLANLKRQAMKNTKGLDRDIARTQRLVEQSVDIVHRFARDLRPTVLDDLGLIPALRTFMKGFTQETGIRVHLSAFAGVEEVNGDKRTVLYRVAQEALTNVARHARASTAEVKIQKVDGCICMKIKDDGKGFEKERVLSARRGQRLGLLGMRERLDMVGGKFTVTSRPSKGTTVLAQVPLMTPLRGGGEKGPLIALPKTKL